MRSISQFLVKELLDRPLDSSGVFGNLRVHATVAVLADPDELSWRIAEARALLTQRQASRFDERTFWEDRDRETDDPEAPLPALGDPVPDT